MKRLVLLLALSCGPHDVEIIRFPDGGKPMHMSPCETNAQCTGDEFCAKFNCNEPFGQCRLRESPMCRPGGGQVCGCDNVTYVSRCAREAAGIASDVAGACQ